MEYVCILADDDSMFVDAVYHDLRSFFDKKSMKFEFLLSVKEVANFIKNAKSKSSKNKIIVPLAIVDLWLVDKENNISNTQAGYEILRMLRGEWPDSYIIILSAHIKNNVKSILSDYTNIAILNKPTSTSELKSIIDDKLEEMGV
ncbi:hypothetical protein ACFLSX_00790 [Calditrichota bacterium]